MEKSLCHKSRGFTLVELLVIICIIAVLAVLLFPMGKKMVDRSITTQCLAKVRAVGLGVMNYTTDYGATPIFDEFGWQGRGLPTDQKSGSNWYTKIIEPGYANRASFFCPAATRLAPDMTNPARESISAYALQLNGVAAMKLGAISPEDSFDWDASDNRNFYKSNNVPLVMEYMAAHPGGTLNAFFCDGSARTILSANKFYGLVTFETNPGDFYMVFTRDP